MSGVVCSSTTMKATKMKQPKHRPWSATPNSTGHERGACTRRAPCAGRRRSSPMQQEPLAIAKRSSRRTESWRERESRSSGRWSSVHRHRHAEDLVHRRRRTASAPSLLPVVFWIPVTKSAGEDEVELVDHADRHRDQKQRQQRLQPDLTRSASAHASFRWEPPSHPWSARRVWQEQGRRRPSPDREWRSPLKANSSSSILKAGLNEHLLSGLWAIAGLPFLRSSVAAPPFLNLRSSTFSFLVGD